jgi:acylphosphatase
MARLHVVVRGRVQGVFYRHSAAEYARELGLTGWVRNRYDGSVEILAEGKAEHLATLRQWLSHGPAGANVRGVDETKENPTGEFVEFSIWPDG